MQKTEIERTEIVLKAPFTSASGALIERVAVRRAKVKDLKAAARITKDAVEQALVIAARVADLTIEDLEEMDLADFGRIQDTFQEWTNPAGGTVADAGATGEVVPVPALGAGRAGT